MLGHFHTYRHTSSYISIGIAGVESHIISGVHQQSWVLKENSSIVTDIWILVTDIWIGELSAEVPALLRGISLQKHSKNRLNYLHA